MSDTYETSLECLTCGCPAALEPEREWVCPNCDCGFVRLVLSERR